MRFKKQNMRRAVGNEAEAGVSSSFVLIVILQVRYLVEVCSSTSITTSTPFWLWYSPGQVHRKRAGWGGGRWERMREEMKKEDKPPPSTAANKEWKPFGACKFWARCNCNEELRISQMAKAFPRGENQFQCTPNITVNLHVEALGLVPSQFWFDDLAVAN